MSKRYRGSYDYGYPYYTPSTPIKAKGGIKVKSKKGEMAKKWWSKRFIEILTSYGWTNRLDRGRRYARSGQVLRVSVEKDKVSAEVQGSMPKPYKVEIQFPAISEGAWTKIVSSMKEKPEFVAQLLAGEVMPELEALFKASGSSLFPLKSKDIKMECSCPDYAVPCKHISAVFYVLGDTFDEDPFLLFQLRGRTKEEIMKSISESVSAKEGPATIDSSLTVDKESVSKDMLDNFWKSPRMKIPITHGGDSKSVPPLLKYPLPSDFDDETVSKILEKYYADIKKGLEQIRSDLHETN